MIQNRIRKKQLDYTWPGFVDALSSLLMVIIFVLMIFVISQFFISQKMSGQDEALVKLKNNLTELTELLSLERDTTTELTAQLSFLEEQFTLIKADLIKEKAITKQYQEEIEGTKNIISFNENEINKLKIALEEKIKNTNLSPTTLISFLPFISSLTLPKKSDLNFSSSSTLLARAEFTSFPKFKVLTFSFLSFALYAESRVCN